MPADQGIVGDTRRDSDAANAWLLTPPPGVPIAFAAEVAAREYGFRGPIASLSSERDRNFVVDAAGAGAGGARIVLKFINSAEPQDELDCQIALLEHLETSAVRAITPRPLRTVSAARHFVATTPAGAVLRGRAYGFLEGRAATEAPASPGLRRALGRRLAEFDHALAGFTHPGTSRPFLWDLMQIGALLPLTHVIDEPQLRAFARAFLERFVAVIRPRLAELPHQAIHNDLSKSNYLVAPEDAARIVAILDFGDVVHAPRVVDLAITASYQIGDAADPLLALEEVAAGFDSVTPLAHEERACLRDLVTARLVQRLVITEWRAAHFPENRVYILRHNPEARRVLRLLSGLP
ncbi:phosphotransferase [Robbsia sp. Bb-Pol-6]|uniref:Hydroxylysine kinase n=1 Tax=Robbsia betulipollinis TaxID=2981849 RepID=A0ABT3ZP61_9BURK|nr:phosphotransferase [Robbsia betulipollinis]MCY0388020.1 phosphotransferase [Robbsia betulipollinis]